MSHYDPYATFPIGSIFRGRSSIHDDLSQDVLTSRLKRASARLKKDVRDRELTATSYVSTSFAAQPAELSEVQNSKIQMAIARLWNSAAWSDLRNELSSQTSAHCMSRQPDDLRQYLDVPGLQAFTTAGELAYRSEVLPALTSGLDYLRGENALSLSILFKKRFSIEASDHVLSVGSPFDRPFAGTGADLLDQELLEPLRMPRPWIALDYPGPSSNPRYVDRRVQLGILDDRRTADIRNEDLSRGFGRRWSVRDLQRLGRATTALAGVMDRLHSGDFTAIAEDAVAIPEISSDLAESLDRLSSIEPTDLQDQDVLVIEQLRYAMWVLQRVDVVVFYVDPDDVISIIGEANSFLEAALQLVDRSQRTHIEEVSQALRRTDDLSLSPPNAITEVRGFSWSDRLGSRRV